MRCRAVRHRNATQRTASGVKEPQRRSMAVRRRSIAISVSVCLSVCSLAYLKNTCPNFIESSTHVACGHGSVLLSRQRNALRTSGFADDVTISHNGQAYAARIGCMLKVTQHGQHRGGWSVMSTNVLLNRILGHSWHKNRSLQKGYFWPENRHTLRWFIIQYMVHITYAGTAITSITNMQ